MKKLNHILSRAVLMTLVAAMLPTMTGCRRGNGINTVLQRGTGVSEAGPESQNRTGQGNQGNLGNSNPINPGFNPNAGLNPTTVPILPGNVENPDEAHAADLRGRPRDEQQFANETVYFDFDKANVKESEVGKIRTVAEFMKAHANHGLEIQGHCDERGTEEYNRSLGERRAQAVREFLAREGVNPNMILTISFGEDRPAESGHNEAAWSKNRRGFFVLLLPPSK